MIREGFLSLILLNCCFSFNILPRFKSYNTPFQNVRACPLTLRDANFHRSKVSLLLSVEPQAHQQIIDEIKTMSIKDIKEELDKRGIKHLDLFEKSEFIQRLAKARSENVGPPVKNSEQVEETRSEMNAKKHDSQDGNIRKQVEAMSLSAIRSELDALKISTKGAFDKRDLIDLLVKARTERSRTSEKPPASSRSSEFRDVVTTKMSREPAPDSRSSKTAQGNPFASGLGSMFGGGFGGANPFAQQAPTQPGGFGGNTGMGEILSKVLGNPQAMAFVQKAMQNPKVMAAMQEIQRDPSKVGKYMADPEIGSIISQLRQFL